MVNNFQDASKIHLARADLSQDGQIILAVSMGVVALAVGLTFLLNAKRRGGSIVTKMREPYGVSSFSEGVNRMIAISIGIFFALAGVIAITLGAVSALA